MTNASRCALVLALTLTCSIVALVAAPRALMPVDDAATHPDFFSFRANLQRAIATHDAAGVLAAVDPSIKNSFGGNDGIDEFKSMWALDGAGSALWQELGTVLALGGTFADAHTFVAPYVFSRWPGELDAFEHVAVIGAAVRVRARPRLDAETLDTVSFSILSLAERTAATDAAWTAVQTEKGTGYVASRLVRSPIDYRATFSDASGQWRLTIFVAGD